MDIFLVNTTSGLFPHSDTDYEKKIKLKINQVYKCTIKKARNYELLKKYFALINCSWEYLNEKTQAHFRNSKESYRKTCEISAGHCDTVFSLERKEWLEMPKSVSFDSMDEYEFRELYDNVKNVIFLVFLKHIKLEDFERELINF